jgi:hypothetical protein
MNRSLLIGLSSTCPLNAIGASSALSRPGDRPAARVVAAGSMLLVSGPIVVGPREALALRRPA